MSTDYKVYRQGNDGITVYLGFVDSFCLITLPPKTKTGG